MSACATSLLLQAGHPTSLHKELNESLGFRKLHGAVVDGRLHNHLLVNRDELRVEPRSMISLLGHQVHHALHVARREIINPWTSRHTLVLCS